MLKTFPYEYRCVVSNKNPGSWFYSIQIFTEQIKPLLFRRYARKNFTLLKTQGEGSQLPREACCRSLNCEKLTNDLIDNGGGGHPHYAAATLANLLQ